jgi:hypothetical protein
MIQAVDWVLVELACTCRVSRHRCTLRLDSMFGDQSVCATHLLVSVTLASGVDGRDPHRAELPARSRRCREDMPDAQEDGTCSIKPHHQTGKRTHNILANPLPIQFTVV